MTGNRGEMWYISPYCLWENRASMKFQIKLKPHLFYKPTAIFLSISFMFFTVLQYAPSGYADPEASITIPKEWGSVEESFVGKSDKTIIYIQDAHDSLEAQENISKIIQYMVSENGIQTVFEEGYEGPVPSDEFFGDIEDPKVKEKVSFDLMDQLRISGAEYAHINRKKDFKLIGVDKIKLHLENIKAYKESSVVKQQVKVDLRELQKEIKVLTERYFPNELKRWMKLRGKLDRKELNLFDYLKRTEKLLSNIDLDSRYPSIALLRELEQVDVKGSQEQMKKIDAKTLFAEVELMENDLVSQYLDSERDLKLWGYHKGFALLERLNAVEITQEEYEVVKDSLASLNTRECIDFISSYGKKSIVLSKRWESNIEKSIRFYEIANARDQSIKNHIGKFVDFSQENLAILVFGGFHSNAIKQILKDKGVSYVVVSPRISEISSRHQAQYKRIMSEDSVGIEDVKTMSEASRPHSFFEIALRDVDAQRQRLRLMQRQREVGVFPSADVKERDPFIFNAYPEGFVLSNAASLGKGLKRLFSGAIGLAALGGVLTLVSCSIHQTMKPEPSTPVFSYGSVESGDRSIRLASDSKYYPGFYVDLPEGGPILLDYTHDEAMGSKFFTRMAKPGRETLLFYENKGGSQEDPRARMKLEWARDLSDYNFVNIKFRNPSTVDGGLWLLELWNYSEGSYDTRLASANIQLGRDNYWKLMQVGLIPSEKPLTHITLTWLGGGDRIIEIKAVRLAKQPLSEFLTQHSDAVGVAEEHEGQSLGSSQGETLEHKLAKDLLAKAVHPNDLELFINTQIFGSMDDMMAPLEPSVRDITLEFLSEMNIDLRNIYEGSNTTQFLTRVVEVMRVEIRKVKDSGRTMVISDKQGDVPSKPKEDSATGKYVWDGESFIDNPDFSEAWDLAFSLSDPNFKEQKRLVLLGLSRESEMLEWVSQLRPEDLLRIRKILFESIYAKNKKVLEQMLSTTNVLRVINQRIDSEGVFDWSQPVKDSFLMEAGSGGGGKMAFYPDATHIVEGGNEGNVRVWDVDKRKQSPVGEFLKLDGSITNIEFNPQGSHLLVESNVVRKMVRSERLRASISKKTSKGTGGVLKIVTGENGERKLELATGSPSLWEEKLGVKRLLSSSNRGRERFSPDGLQLVTYGKDKAAQILDVETGEPIIKKLKTFLGTVSFAVMSPGGELVATLSQSNKHVYLWQRESGEKLEKVFIHEKKVVLVRFNRTGSEMLTVTEDYSIHRWDIAAGELVGEEIKHKNAVADVDYNFDGNRILVASNDYGQLYRNTKKASRFGKKLRHDQAVNAAVLSPKSDKVATASDDGTVRIWKEKTQRLLGEPLVHDSPVLSVLFSPDGSRLATATEDGSLKVWYAPLSDRYKYLGQHFPELLHPNERRLSDAKSLGAVVPTIQSKLDITTLSSFKERVNLFINYEDLKNFSREQLDEIFKYALRNKKQLQVVVVNASPFNKHPLLNLPNIYFTSHSEQKASKEVRKAKHNLHLSRTVDPSKDFALIGGNKFRYPNDDNGLLGVALLYTQAKDKNLFLMEYGLKQVDGFFSVVKESLLALIQANESQLLISRAA